MPRKTSSVVGLLATKNAIRYFIGVKARNEMRQGDVGLNESYNLALIPDALNKRLKEQGNGGGGQPWSSGGAIPPALRVTRVGVLWSQPAEPRCCEDRVTAGPRPKA
jgi:hypothetical protein